MPISLTLADHVTREDLRVYLERVCAMGQPEVRLVAKGSILAVFGCTQKPEGLIDSAPVVLVLRSFQLAAQSITDAVSIDTVVAARALLDRMARMTLIGLTLELPEMTVAVGWAGVLPPHQTWQSTGTIDAPSLARVAEEGIRRIANALPDNPGEPVVRAAQRQVWGMEIAPGIPAAAAFAAEGMGFLADEKLARVFTTHTWSRLQTTRGEVLIRSPLG